MKKVSLSQYRTVDGKWQFVPVPRDLNTPIPIHSSVRDVTRSIHTAKTDAKLAANLSKALLCAMLLCCSGCFGHKIAIEKGFRLRENSGTPMLIPTNGQSSDPGNFQTATLVLPGVSAIGKDQVSQQCISLASVFHPEMLGLRTDPVPQIQRGH